MDYYNGLKFNKILLPEEVISHILSYLDAPHLLKCRLVCNKWNDIITSNALWCLKYQREYHHTPKVLPWYINYHLFSSLFNQNLLKNVNGKYKFENWTITDNGGNGFIVEKEPIGSDPLPKNVPEFENATSCFVTSFELCSKTQTIEFTDSQLEVLKTYKPQIYVSEWIAPRFDCGCLYVAELWVICEDGKNILGGRMLRIFEQWIEAKWSKVEMVITDYPDNIEYLEFIHGGKDKQFWRGHYGIKMAGAVVKLLVEPI